MLAEFLADQGRLGSGDARRTGLPVLPGGGDFPLPLQLAPLHFETLFCLAGAMTLTRRDGSSLTASVRQVLLLTDLSNLTEASVDALWKEFWWRWTPGGA